MASRYRNLAVNTALFAANAVATKLVTFLLVPLYTSCMSTGEYGVADMSLTVISLVTPLATLSIADAAVRYMVGDRGNGNAYAFIGLAITLLSVALVALLTPLLDLGVFGGLGEYKALFVLAYASSALLQLCGEVARGSGEVRLIPVCAAVSSALTCVLAVLLIGLRGTGVVGYFVSVSAGPLVAVAVYLSVGGLWSMAARGASELFGGRTTALVARLRPMLSYSLPLIPNSLFWWAGTSINRFFITGMLGISASGLFAAAGKVPNLLNVAYSVFQQAWQLSAFQESGEDGSQGLGGFFESVFRVLQAGMTILCAVVSLASPLLARLFLQGEFYDGWTMIPVLLLANLMSVLNSFYGTVYTTTMHTSYIMRTTVVGAVACVALTPVLIGSLGVLGACVASAVSQGLVFAMRARDSRRYVAFDAGWGALLPTLGLLVAQAAVTALQAKGWVWVSVACLVAVVALQGRRVAGIARVLLARMRGRG